MLVGDVPYQVEYILYSRDAGEGLSLKEDVEYDMYDTGRGAELMDSVSVHAYTCPQKQTVNKARKKEKTYLWCYSLC